MLSSDIAWSIPLRIYSYPVKSAAANEDLILISDSADSNKTKQLKVSSLPGGSTAGVSSITIASGTSTGNALVASSPTGGVTLTTNAFALNDNKKNRHALKRNRLAISTSHQT